jgi:hypothetical protein
MDHVDAEHGGGQCFPFFQPMSGRHMCDMQPACFTTVAALSQVPGSTLKILPRITIFPNVVHEPRPPHGVVGLLDVYKQQEGGKLILRAGPQGSGEHVGIVHSAPALPEPLLCLMQAPCSLHAVVHAAVEHAVVQPVQSAAKGEGSCKGTILPP